MCPGRNEMKHQKMIKLIVMTGLVLGPLYATASSFGGGWVQNKATGTLYYSLAPTPDRQQLAADRQAPKSHTNGFGGGWAHDKATGTLSYQP